MALLGEIHDPKYYLYLSVMWRKIYFLILYFVKRKRLWEINVSTFFYYSSSSAKKCLKIHHKLGNYIALGGEPMQRMFMAEPKNYIEMSFKS